MIICYITILIAFLKLMDDVSHFADSKGDSLPTKGVEIVHFNLVILLPSIAQICCRIYVFFCNVYSFYFFIGQC